MSFEDLTLVFNGEIYNFLEIRADLENLGHKFKSNSDTEVLLKAFSQWGIDCIPKLNGMFAFAIFNKSIGNKRKCSNDEYPVPKSSNEILMPSCDNFSNKIYLFNF